MKSKLQKFEQTIGLIHAWQVMLIFFPAPTLQVSSLFKVIIFMVETGQKWVRNIWTQYFGIGSREKVVGRRKMTWEQNVEFRNANYSKWSKV